jgi:hypothetical protein
MVVVVGVVVVVVVEVYMGPNVYMCNVGHVCSLV